MKVFTILLVIMIFIASFWGIQNTSNHDNYTTEIVISDENYIISKEYSGNADQSYQYQYQIFNDDHILLEEGTLTREPNIDVIDGKLISFAVQTGTGLSTQWGFFYDLETNTRSKDYYWILDYSKTRVVLGDPEKIIIRSIFDDNYYKELTEFTYSLASVADSILEARFIEQDTAINVTYLKEGSLEMVSETIPIGDKGTVLRESS